LKETGKQMKATKRRQRKPDPLASPTAVRDIYECLTRRLPFPIPKSEKELFRLLYAIGHVERRPATDTKRGWPGRWTREQLTEPASILRGVLDRETQGRVSVKSFISQYLHILRSLSLLSNHNFKFLRNFFFVCEGLFF
jgi:hypothetical protein